MEASKLKEILDQHQLWIETKGKQGVYADLGGADLRDANLRVASLRGANLTGANLTGAYLGGAYLGGANLYGANLEDVSFINAYLCGANLSYANLSYANLRGANLMGADLTNAILPDISWIIPGCLVQLNHVMCDFYLEKERKWDNFVQDSFGFFIQNDVAEDTFDMLLGDRIIRGIPDWVKYTGLRQIESESV